jgi:DNA polymerase theta
MTLDLRLDHLGLRSSFVAAFNASNIRECYPWQAAALREATPAGVNFVYTAPTSGGKSLVADVLMLQRIQKVVEDWKKPRAKALVLVPYLSIGSSSRVMSPAAATCRSVRNTPCT